MGVEVGLVVAVDVGVGEEGVTVGVEVVVTNMVTGTWTVTGAEGVDVLLPEQPPIQAAARNTNPMAKNSECFMGSPE